MDPKAKQYFTTAEIAEICDVSIVSVGNWIRAEKLKAYRPPRGHYRVARKDFILFLNESGMPVPRGLEDGVAIRVLVVDDEPMVRAVVANILESTDDVSVATAADGFEAGRMVAELRPDVVVLDLRMPGMDGATVCRRIKNDPKTAKTRVLFLTGHQDPDSVKLIRESGADGYIGKPFVAQELLAAVRGLSAGALPV